MQEQRKKGQGAKKSGRMERKIISPRMNGRLHKIPRVWSKEEMVKCQGMMEMIERFR